MIIWDVAKAAERTTLARHTSAITCVAFAADGRTLATGSLDWTVKVWDLASGALRHSLDGHRDAIDAVAFAPDGKTLASTSRDGTTRLWDLAKAAGRASLRSRSGSVGAVAFLPDGRSLFTGGADGSLRRWDAADGHAQAIRTEAHPAPLAALAVAGNGQTLASGGGDRQLKLWDVAVQLAPRPFAGVEAKVRSLVLSRRWQGARIGHDRRRGPALGPEDWAGSGAIPSCSDAQDVQLALSPDGKILATLPVGSGIEYAQALGYRDPARDGPAAGGRAGRRPGPGLHPRRPVAGDGRRAAYLCLDWTRSDRSGPSNRDRGAWLRSIAVSPDGSTIATAGGDGVVTVWDVAPACPSPT